MKKCLFLAFCVLQMTFDFGQAPKRFEILGDISGLKNSDSLYLITNKGNKPDTVARSGAVEGKFRFTGRVLNKVNWYFIKVNYIKENYIRLLLENTVIHIRGKLENWPDVHVEGSPSQNDYSDFMMGYDLIRRKVDSLNRLAQQATGTRDSLKHFLLRTKIDAQLSFSNAYWTQFIVRHLYSLYTPFLILKTDWSVSEKTKYYSLLPVSVQKSQFGMDLNAELEVLQHLSIDSLAPDFEGISPAGIVIRLHDIVSKNKITLIDFWASWCIPCRMETPNLRKQYQIYRDRGFDILSVSLDFDEMSWKMAIKQDSMIWDHLSELKGRDQNSAKLYHINGIPAFILVNSSGRLIGMDLPGSNIPWAETGSLHGEELGKRLKQLFSE